MLCLGKKIFHPFCDLFCHLRVEAAFPEHLICNQIGHALQKDHAVLRDEQLIQLCISFYCLEAFSCTHVPVSADAPVAFFVKSLHGGDIDPSGFAKGKYGFFRKSRFSASAASCYNNQHIISAPRTVLH